MTDEAFRALVHRVELRLERLETRVDALEQRFTDGCTEIRTTLEGLESRVNTKAGTWVVSLGGATLAGLLVLCTLGQ